MARAPDLHSLLAALDPTAPLAARHLWLITLCEWIRGNRRSVQGAVSRIHLLLDAVEARPELQRRLQAWWDVLVHTVDTTTLLADFGFAPRIALFSELAERVRRKLLPGTPETIDASELFSLALPTAFDAQWLAALTEPQLDRIARALVPGDGQDGSLWQQSLLDAIVYCAGQILATGFAPELRLRMSSGVRDARPFHAVIRDVEALRIAVLRQPNDPEAVARATQDLRERLDACRQAVATVYAHLEENGISVGLVFRLRQLRERVLRIRDLLDCVLSPSKKTSAVRLLARLVAVGQERRSIRVLLSSNTSLLAAKVAERSAETGESYITRDRAAYAVMLRKAAGGGVLTAGTTLGKFMLGLLALSAFWSGFWSGVLYAASFVVIQLLHCTLATKQPAMTAPAMAAKLKELISPEAVDAFVNEVTHLVRSQVAAVLGNVLAVFPTVLGVSALFQLALGHPMIDRDEADHVFKTLHLLGPTLLFAGFTGVLLFAASIIAGWAENWFVLHRVDSAMRYNPRITRWFGAERAARWALFVRTHISGFASNLSLGFMLGLIPAFAAFFGLGLEARHVTLSSGQLAAAAAAYGIEVVHVPAFWWCVASIPLIGTLNLGVSFYFAFRLALRAHSVSVVNRARIRAAILARVGTAPLSFLLPRRTPVADAALTASAASNLTPSSQPVPPPATGRPASRRARR